MRTQTSMAEKWRKPGIGVNLPAHLTTCTNANVSRNIKFVCTGSYIWYLLRKHPTYKGCDRLQFHTGMGGIPNQQEGEDKSLIGGETPITFQLTV